MAEPQKNLKADDERAADLIDVHILDLAAQIEALLRGVREIQRGVLQVRGAVPRSPGQDPGQYVRRRIAEMLSDCDALRDVIESATDAADALGDAVPLTDVTRNR